MEVTQEMIEAYTAGIIDGEGYIGLTRIGKGYHARLTVGQSEQRWHLFDFLMEHFPNGKLYGPFQQDSTRARKKLLFWTGNDAVQVIERIRRFLVLKGEAADVLVEFQEALSRQPRNGRLVRWTTNFREFAKKCYDRCRFLNRDGPEPQELRVESPADKGPSLFD